MKESIFNEILEWSKTLSQWQADAVRRLFVQGKLTEEDFDEIFCMAKAHYRIKQAITPPAPTPLSEEHIPAPPTKGKPTILTSMFDVMNVNALVAEQTLTFGPKGLTIIYGGNGTGKSGYARVLKRACRARHTEKTILPNLFSKDLLGPPEASFTLNTEPPKQVKWAEGESTPPELSELAVFDSHCARVFIDEANEVSYIPFGLDIFPNLAQLCEVLKSRALQESNALDFRETILDELNGPHEVGSLMESFSSQTTPESIEALATLSKKETAHHKELERQLQDLKRNDPRKGADGLRRLQRRIDNLIRQLKAEYDALSDEFIAGANVAWRTAKQTAKAARMASVRQFDKEPLSGVGSDTWKTMLRYVEEYSVQAAYPGKPFPVTDEGSRCVLCHQPLQDDAKDRLKRFWNFIQDRTEQKANLARIELKKFVVKAREFNVLPIDQELIKEIETRDPGLPSMLSAHEKRMKERALKLIENMQNDDWATPPHADFAAAEHLETYSLYLTEKAYELDKLAKPEEIAKREAEFSELAARAKLSKHKDAVLRQLHRLKERVKYKEFQNSLGTREITIMGGDLTERVLTKALQNALRDELKELNMHIVVSFKKTGQRGQTKHQLQIKEAFPHKQTTLSGVLSEGEQHVIGLAAFLAELQVAEGDNGIILDDPVSSLDHRWMDRVAERLVKEARKRQVIVLTHNISFILSTKKFAAKEQVPIHAQWLRRFKNVPGHCSPETPWEILGAKERRKILTGLALKARENFEIDPEGEEFQSLHNKFYSELRATWERTVEEVVLNQTVLRFRNGVETNRLKRVVLEDEDFKAIFEAMSKASEETPAHDHAADLCHALQTPDQMDAEIHKLKEFTKQLEDKQRDANRRRNALIEPPKV